MGLIISGSLQPSFDVQYYADRGIPAAHKSDSTTVSFLEVRQAFACLSAWATTSARPYNTHENLIVIALRVKRIGCEGLMHVVVSAAQRGNHCINVFVVVVEGQRWADGGLLAKAAQCRLGTVVAGAHRNTFAVERGAHVLGLVALEDEGQYARLLLGRADDAEPRNRSAVPAVA